MSESSSKSEQPETSPSDQKPKMKPRHRKLMKILGVVGAVCVLLLVFLPSIASMGWVRSIVLSKVNAQLNGEVQIDDWSFGWFSGTRVHNLRVFQDKTQIFQAGDISMDISVLSVIRGQMYKLGKTSVRDVSFVLVRYPDGSNNFAKLSKVSSDPNAPAAALPAGLSVQFDGDIRGTIEERFANGTSQITYIDKSTVSAAFADINGMITSKLNLTIRDADGQTGTITTDGSIRLFEKGLLAIERIEGNHTVEIKSVHLGVLDPFLPPGFPLDTVAGRVDGKFTVKVAGKDSVVAEGGLTVTDFAATGPALNDDVYKNAKITLTLPPTILNRAAAPRICIGQPGKAEKLVIALDRHGSISVTADSSLDALMNLAANKAPGDTGQLGVAVNLDLAALANQIPHAFRLREGLKLTGGTYDNRVLLTLAKDKASFSQKSTIAGLEGEIDGKAIKAQPVSVSISADDFGGGGVLPDLRNIVVNVESAFGSAKGGGDNLSRLKLSGNVTLAELSGQFGQFIDLAQMGIASLSGDMGFSLTTSTDPAKPSSPTTLDATLTTSKLTVQRTNPAGQPLPLLTNYDSAFTTSATLSSDATADVVNLTALSLTDSAGMLAIAKDPVTPLTFTMPVKGTPSASGKLSIKGNLVTIGDLLAGMRGPMAHPPVAKITAGALVASLDISRTPAGTKLALDGGISGLAITLPGQPIQNESVQLNLVANANDAFTAISIPTLDLKSNFASAALDQPIAIKLGGPGGMDLSGAITVKGQLKPILGLAEALQFAAPNSLVNYGGNFVITQKFSTNGSQLVADGQTVVNDFTVGNLAKPSFKEASLKIANNVRLDQSAKLVNIQNVSVEMTQTKAASVVLSGKIQQYDTQGIFSGMTLTLGYDLAAAYKAVVPILQAGATTPEQRQLFDDIKVAGVRRDIRIPITGRYPLNDPAALKYIVAQAVVGFDAIEYQGIEIRNYDLPISLADGKVRTIYADKQGDARFAKPGRANDGTIDLSGWEISLIDKPMRLTCVRENYAVLNKVNIQEKSLAHFLGSVSPIFYGTSKAKGLVNVTVAQVKNLPLDASIMQSRNDPNAFAKVAFSITDMGVKAPFVDILGGQLNLKTQDGMVPMQLRDGAVAWSDGVVDSTMKLDFGGQVLGADKAVIRLADKKILAMYLTIPKTMLPAAARQDFVKDTLVVPVAGTLSSPSFNITEAVTKSVSPEAVIKAAMSGKKSKGGGLLGGGLGNILGGGDKEPAKVAPEPRTTPKPDPKTPAVKQPVPKPDPKLIVPTTHPAAPTTRPATQLPAAPSPLLPSPKLPK